MKQIASWVMVSIMAVLLTACGSEAPKQPAAPSEAQTATQPAAQPEVQPAVQPAAPAGEAPAGEAPAPQ
ncbi:MAG: hypothetical protein NTW94_03905 [Legionellales bacterium]|nr:hypothetical protein [Legionellales bacterium]